MQAVQAFEQALAPAVFDDYRAAKLGAAALRRAHKRKAQREVEPTTVKRARLMFLNPEDAIVEIAAFGVQTSAPPVGCYYKDSKSAPVAYITDPEAYHAALRAQLADDTDYGPVQEWAALVDMDGSIEVQIFKGSLAALRKLMPCEDDRINWELAGGDLTGTAKPIQVERFGV